MRYALFVIDVPQGFMQYDYNRRIVEFIAQVAVVVGRKGRNGMSALT